MTDEKQKTGSRSRVKFCDLTGPSFNEQRGKWVVHEQLYPESRGYEVYEFVSQEAAQSFIDNSEGADTHITIHARAE